MVLSPFARAERARRAAWILLLAAGALALDQSLSLAADAAYGEYLAAECAACHGDEGAKGAVPSLRVLPYDHLVGALEEYRDGTRADAAMRAVVRSLGDAEIEALAAYFSGGRDRP